MAGTGNAYGMVRMNENSPSPQSPVALSAALKKKLHSLRWKPEAVMRETVLIQRLRAVAVVEEAA